MEIPAINKRREELSREIIESTSAQLFEQSPLLTETAIDLANNLKGKIQQVLPLYTTATLALVQAEQYDKALEIINIVLKVVPKDVKLLNLKGKILRQLGDNKEALECFNHVLEINPNDISSLVNRGMVLLELEEYKKAQEDLEQARQHKPEDPLILEVLAEGLGSIGSHFLDLGNYPKALELLNKALELNPNDALGLVLIGIALRNQGSKQEAIESLQRAITLDPTLARAYAELGKTWTEMGEYEKAVQTLQTSLSLKQDPALEWANANLGESLLMLERYEEALVALNKALKFDSQNKTISSRSMEFKAIALFEVDRYPEALQVLDQALKLANSDYTFIFRLQAEIFCDIAEYEKAVEVLDKAIQRYPKYDRLFELKGWALSHLKRIKEAQQAYESAHKLNSSDLWLKKGIAETYYLLNKPEDSKHLYEEIIKEAETRTEEFYFDLLGWCYYRLGKFNTSAKFFIQALSILRVEDTIQFSTQFDLSLAFMCSKRYELGLQEYKKGVENINDNYNDDKYAPRRCGFLFVALSDFKDAFKNNPELEKHEKSKEVLDLLEKAFDEANKSKREILSNISKEQEVSPVKVA